MQRISNTPHWSEILSKSIQQQTLEPIDRREKILNCAEKEFAQLGFHKADLRKIAEQAGVSKATIYKLFKSKDDILFTIVDENFTRLRDIVLLNMMGSGTPINRMRTSFYELARYLDQHKTFCQLVVRGAGESMVKIQAMYNTVVQESIPLADAFFSDFRQSGSVPDIPTQDLLKLITDMVFGVICSWVIADNEQKKLEDEVDFYFNLFENNMDFFTRRTSES